MLNQYRYHAGQFAIKFSELKFTGSEVESFLQNQSTFDIIKIRPDTFQLVSFLDPQGRLEIYGWLVKDGVEFSYLVPTSLTAKAIERLNKYLISEDVSISEAEEITCLILIGPEAAEFRSQKSFQGVFFGEEAYLQKSSPVPDLPLLSAGDVEVWGGLTGWPAFDGSDFSQQIINNLRLYDLSVSINKGCYPGQETVSKIATRRGAAYSPVLLEVGSSLSAGEIFSFDKKIGTASKCFTWEGSFYLACELLRDFRVEGMKLQFLLNGSEYHGVVKYYPLLSGSRSEKAKELFYAGSDCFLQDDLELAEEKFRLSIKLDPQFADAYESLGVMLGRQNRFEEAIEIMDKLNKVDSKSVMAHTNKSMFLMKLGRIEEAEEEKSQATLKSFQKFGDEAKHKAMEEEQKKAKLNEWDQRESMFKQVLEIDPDDTLANYGLGSIAVEKQEWEKARQHLERVLIQDPKYSVAYLALGKTYKGLGKLVEARETWEQGIKVAAAKGDLMPANQMQQELLFNF